MATRSKTKTAYRHEHADKRPHATARYIRIATRKCTIVADLIRGKSMKEAQAILTYCPKAAAAPMLKVLNSAVANAENNLELNRDDLFVAEAFANQGPTLKRFRARARGSASSILKRTSHLTVILDQQAK